MKKSKTLSEKLKGYSLLSAGIIASSAAADAQIVYTDVNPDSTNVGVSTYAFDLNHDGITDFTLSVTGFNHGSHSSLYSMDVLPASNNAVAASFQGYAQVANSGDRIDSNLDWVKTEGLGYYYFKYKSRLYWTYMAGHWSEQSMKFLPLRFTINGEQHYGWIRLSVVRDYSSFTVHDYAYESKPNVPIIAGVTGCTLYYADKDSDGFGDKSDPGLLSCSYPGTLYSIFNTDCNDSNPSINPNEKEICNTIDDNCDGQIDEGVQKTFYADHDGDGYGTSIISVQACSQPSGYVVDSTDCNDTNAFIHPIAPLLRWQKSLGGSNIDRANSIKQTTEGGYIVAGYSYSNDGDVSGHHVDNYGTDYWVVKLDTSENIEWQKSLGGSGDDGANSIQQTTDGGFVVAGTSNSNDGDVSGNHGGSDDWIVKLDTSGNIEWQKSLGGSSDDGANSIQQTTEGGFIVAGYSYSNDGDISGHHGATSQPDYWLIKLDASGNIEWQKSFGGSRGDYAYSIQQTNDSGFIVAGYSISKDGDVSENRGGNDFWVVKLDASGNIQWQKSLGGSQGDYANSIQLTTDGGYIVAGYSYSKDGDVSGHHGHYDYWIVKLGASGNIQWQKSLGGSGYDEAYSIQQTTDGGFIVAGTSNSNSGDVSGHHYTSSYTDDWIVKLDISGNIEWQESLGGSGDDGATSIQQTTDGGFIVAGSSGSNDDDVFGNHGGGDYWIVKLQAIFGGIEICNNLDDNCDGRIDEGFNLTTYYQDADGDGYGTSTSSMLACSQPQGYVVDGTDCDDTNPNVNPGAKEIPNNGIDDNCNGQIDENSTGINPVTNSTPALSVFPNPTNGNFIIELKVSNQITEQAMIEVINVLGQIVLSQNAEIIKGKLSQEIKLNSEPSGIYSVKVILNKRAYTQQINLQK